MVTPTMRINFDSPCVPVVWRVAVFGMRGSDVDIGIDIARLGPPEWICFTWWSSRWPLDRLGLVNLSPNSSGSLSLLVDSLLFQGYETRGLCSSP